MLLLLLLLLLTTAGIIPTGTISAATTTYMCFTVGVFRTGTSSQTIFCYIPGVNASVSGVSLRVRRAIDHPELPW